MPRAKGVIRLCGPDWSCSLWAEFSQKNKETHGVGSTRTMLGIRRAQSIAALYTVCAWQACTSVMVAMLRADGWGQTARAWHHTTYTVGAQWYCVMGGDVLSGPGTVWYVK